MIGRREQAISEEERTELQIVWIRKEIRRVIEEEHVRIDEDDLAERREYKLA